MKRLALVALAAFVAASLPANAAPKMKRLGEDPSGDGWPTMDLTYLEAGRNRSNLEIRIGLDLILPGTRALIPDLPGVQWAFDVKGRTFVAEAAPGAEARFFLFELFDDGTYEELDPPTGTYEMADGFVRILVPLKSIEARKGTVITGAGQDGNDVDFHVHHAGTTYVDYMETPTKFVVP